MYDLHIGALRSKGGSFGALRSKGGSFIAFIVILKVMIPTPVGALVPKCPVTEEGTVQTDTQNFCQCSRGTMKSGAKVSIKCNFNNNEDVVLTEDLYPFHPGSVMAARVLVRNSTSVRVTAGFWRLVQSVPSVSLDVWRGGDLTLEPSPPAEQMSFHPSLNTFVGIGIIKCSVDSIPESLVRDRVMSGLLIQRSEVGTISKGFLGNVEKVKYLRIENSTVQNVEGPISSLNNLRLVPGSEDDWHGLRICNSTVENIASGAFSFVNEDLSEEAEMCETKFMYNRFGTVETEAITVSGKLDITFRGNTFGLLQKDAVKVNVTGDLKFQENVVDRLKPGGLKSMFCGSGSSMEKNTIHMEAPLGVPYNTTTMPFNASCGNPQVFIVMSPPEPRTEQRTSKATWILLVLILLVVAAVIFIGLFIYRNQTFLREYRRGLSPYSELPERTTMQELCSNQEEDLIVEEMEEGDQETGMCNPSYDIKEPS